MRMHPRTSNNPNPGARRRRKDHQADARKSPDAPQNPEPPEALAGDPSIRDTLGDPGSYQSNHAHTGFGSDDDHGDPDDAKVEGRSRA
jgi:hypothetical protein